MKVLTADRILVFGGVFCLAAPCVTLLANPEVATTTLMQDVYSAVEIVLPLSLDEQLFRDPKNAPEISAKLEQLATFSSQLTGHFDSKTADFEFVANSLARDSREAARLYKKGQFEQARFVVHNLSENCFACHSKLPAAPGHPHSDNVFKKIADRKLEPTSIAKLKAIFRQFQEAEKIYKAEIEKNPDLLATTHLNDYLKLSLRVDLDLESPLLLFGGIARGRVGGIPNREMASTLANQIRYVKTLGHLVKPSLAGVEKLIELGDKEKGIQRSREGLVYYVSASAGANQLLSNPALTNAERSQLYFLAGKTEGHISDGFWFSEMENFLEQAIVLAPQMPWSKLAFEILKEEIQSGYTGSAGTNIPVDVQQRLDSLENKIAPTNPKGEKDKPL